MFLPDPKVRPIVRENLPLAGVSMDHSTTQWLARFGQYWAMDLPVDALLDHQGLEWGNVIDEGPLIVDGWSQLPIVGMDVLKQARSQGQSTVPAWMGAHPKSGWKPVGDDRALDFSEGEALVTNLSKSFISGEELSELLSRPLRPRLANHVNEAGISLMGALLNRLLLDISTEKTILLSAIGSALGSGASNHLGSLSKFSEVQTPWGTCLENYRPHSIIASPYPPMPIPLIEAFMASDLDLSEPAIREWTSAWLSIWRPSGVENARDVALCRIKERWMDAIGQKDVVPTKPRIRL